MTKKEKFIGARRVGGRERKDGMKEEIEKE